MQHRPTSLRIFAYACPYSLKLFAEREKDHATGEARMDGYSNAEQEVEGPELAEIGIAFHACCHAAALAEKKDESRINAVEATALALSHKMNVVRARTGADMALDFMHYWEFDKELSYEHGLAFDRKWKSCVWGAPERRIRMVLDGYGVKTIEDPEWGEMTIAISQDYKTGWGCNEGMLDEIQALCHSTALWKEHPDVDAIEVNIVSTRRHKTFKKRWILANEDDMADLRARQQKIEYYMNAAEQSDLAPRLGYGCASCNYTNECQAFKDHIGKIKHDCAAGLNAIADPVQAAIDLALIENRSKELKAMLKMAARGARIEIDGGSIGYSERDKREVKDPVEILELWFKLAGETPTADDAKRVCRGFVRALDPGVTQMDRILGTLAGPLGMTKKAAKEEYGPKLTETTKSESFGFKKAGGGDAEEE